MKHRAPPSRQQASAASMRPAWSRRSAAGVAQYAAIVFLLVYGLYVGSESMGYNWQWNRVPVHLFSIGEAGPVWGPLIDGLGLTVRISAVAFLLALLLGGLLALGRLGGSPLPRWTSRAVIELVRNTPILVQLYLFYFFLGPVLGLDRFWAGVLCLAVFEAAFVAEVYRAGVESVPRGQWEAARALGLPAAPILRRVIFPQALRLMLPPMTGEAISVVKNSAIVSVIALTDLTGTGRNIIADTYLSLEIWFTVGALYLVLALLLSLAGSMLERRHAVPAA